MYRYLLKYQVGNSQVVKNITPRVNGKILRKTEGYRVRYSFSGSITLQNEVANSIHDYDLFKSIEDTSYATQCYIEIQKKNTTWEKVFEGYFYPFECEVNDDLCFAVVKELKPYDQYSEIDKIYSTSYNVIKEVAPGFEFDVLNPLRLEFFECEKNYNVVLDNTDPNCVKPFTHTTSAVSQWDTAGYFYKGFPADYYLLPQIDYHPAVAEWDLVSASQLYTDYLTFPYYWGLPTTRLPIISLLRPIKNEITINNFLGYVTVTSNGNSFTLPEYNITAKTTWAFEIAVTADDPETGAHQPPSGTDWHLLDDPNASGNTSILINNIPHAKYCRQIFYSNPDYIYGVTSSVCGQYYKYELLNQDGNGTYNLRKIYRSRGFIQTLAAFIFKAGLSYIKSDFFLNGTNPLTGEQNTTYQIATGYDIKFPTDEYPSKDMQLSIQSLIESMQVKIPIDWVIRKETFTHNGQTITDWVFRIEHVYYFENGNSYTGNQNYITDVRGLTHNSTGTHQLLKTNKYAYFIDEIYSLETFKDPQYFNDEFNPLSINYDLSLSEKEKVYSGSFITDLGGVILEPHEFSNSAICLCGIKYKQTGLNTFGWVCESEPDYLTGIYISNGHLSPANLINKYWRKFRILLHATITNVSIIFDSETRKRNQIITITDCDMDKLQTENLIKTNLGNGSIVDAEFDMLQNNTKLSLKL